MSIINNANPGSQIGVLCLIYRVLHRNRDKLDVESLERLCRPDNLYLNENQSKKLGETLNFWMSEDHQLWELNSEKKLKILDEYTLGVRREPSPNEISNIVNKVINGTKILDVLEKESSDVAPLLSAISALLASDYFTFGSPHRITNQNLDVFFANYLPKVHPNNNEKSTLTEYGLFLGYFAVDEVGGVYVDPTKVVRNSLSGVFAEVSDLSASEFFYRLSESIPLLDGGSVRQMVEDEMPDDSVVRFDDKVISTSLSFAIQRLLRESALTRTSTSDDLGAFRLKGLQRDETVLVSSFQYRQKGTGDE